jgi:ectoine hydroxylase-related dioxygenase (phytanoyl-CoA dioxygenase family)
MSSNPLRPVSEAEISAYETDGGVCLRGVIDPDWLARLAEGAEQALKDHGPHHYIQSAAGDAGFFYTEYFLWRRLAPFRDFAMNSPGGEIAARLTRSAEVHFFMDGLFVKEPKTERPSAWHQDQVYYPIEGRKVVIMWFPLDPVSADTALRVVKGSHRWSQSFSAVMLKDDDDVIQRDQGHARPPDFDAEGDRYEILSWDVEPGDCIAFNGMAVHGARGNASASRRRRAVSTTWLGDDTVMGYRSEMEPQYDPMLKLAKGERLVDEELFPQVWPKR